MKADVRETCLHARVDGHALLTRGGLPKEGSRRIDDNSAERGDVYLAFDVNSKVADHELGGSLHDVDNAAGCQAAADVHIHLELLLSPVAPIEHLSIFGGFPDTFAKLRAVVKQTYC